MSKLHILKLDGGHAFGLEGRAMVDSNDAMHITNLDQYELGTTDFSPYDVLVITDFIDQEYLYENRGIIQQFLNSGKIVVACTHIFRSWLPGVNLFMPKRITKFSDYEMEIKKADSVFRGVDMQELAYRKGVSGFYARGYHPVTNPEVEVWLAFKTGEPITYVDRTSTKGTIIASSARDLLSYETGQNTTQLIAPQTLEWLEDEIKRLEERKLA